MLRQFQRRFLDWIRYEAEIRHLQATDDRLLDDMGIVRERIPGAVKGHCLPH